MDAGFMRDILVPHPSGSEAVQIGNPADLSGNPSRNDGPQSSFWIKMRIAATALQPAQRKQGFDFLFVFRAEFHIQQINSLVWKTQSQGQKIMDGPATGLGQ